MSNLLNSIGLCARARKLVSGESLVIDSIAKNRAKVVLISADCEKNTLKKLINKCTYYKKEYYIVKYDKYELGNAIGKSFRVCISIEDDGFKKLVLKNVRE